MYEGYIDTVLNGRIFGWAWRSDSPNEPISVDLYVDSNCENAALASLYRTDLEKAGKGNGRHAFELRLPDRYRDGKLHCIKVCFAGTDVNLYGGPLSVCLDRKPGFAYQVYDAKQRASLDQRARLWAKGNLQNEPKVSVIIPCYNLGEYLDEAVDSVLEQTFQDFEIIIVNDGSTDRLTNELLQNYSRPRTRVVRTENRGPGAARNAGIRIANGSYLCALDADDKLHPAYLEKAVKVLDAAESITFVSCWLQAFGDEDWIWKQERCDLPTLLGECTVATPALVRKEFVLAVGGYDEDPAQWGNEDWLLWISLVEKGYRGTILPEVLFYYRKRSGSLSEFWMQGEAHLKKLRAVISSHGESYRNYLIDVLLRKEGEICDLLRENDATERSIHWSKQEILTWKNEVERLQKKISKVQEGQDVGSRVTELERRIVAKECQIEALKSEQNQLQRREECLATALKDTELQVQAMRQSRSWKLTAPLRAINARSHLLLRNKLGATK